METIDVIIEDILVEKDSGWKVLKVSIDDPTEHHLAVGSFPSLHVGESYRFHGIWRKHAKFGKQFQVHKPEYRHPTTRRGIRRFLVSGAIEGIRAATADKILEAHGNEALEVLADPHRLSMIKGIGKKTAEKASASWIHRQEEWDLRVFLYDHDIGVHDAGRILKKYGTDTIHAVRSNPYQLIRDIRGIGFLKADRIAQSVGLDKNAPERIDAAIAWCLMSEGEEKGHCFLTPQQLLNTLYKKLENQPDNLEIKCKESLARLEKVTAIHKEDSVDQSMIYTRDLFTAETHVSRILKDLNEKASLLRKKRNPKQVKAWLQNYQQSLEHPLSEEQSQAVILASQASLMILTGGPGVGKTTTANAMIQFFQHLSLRVVLTAPTGRAAQRMSELSGLSAKTIHRLLEWSPEEATFKRDQNNPIAADVLIIDESSMIDIRLMEQLLDAIAANTQVIFIGDKDQLPSVGPGQVFSDMIEAKTIPCCNLTTIYRQGQTSHIISAAHAINAGQFPQFSKDASSDCRFFIDHEERVLPGMLTLLETLRQIGYDPAKDIQVLTPMNRGPLGSVNLNEHIRKQVNPTEALKATQIYKKGDRIFQVGDKVIQTTNNYELNVFNGDIGRVLHVKSQQAALQVKFADRIVAYAEDQVDQLSLAYAITIHKSQGSEFPVVIIPIVRSHHMMLQRNLIYTGLTRAKKLAILIGAEQALGTAIRTISSTQRQSRLKQRLQL